MYSGELAGILPASSVAAHEVCVCGVDEGLELHPPHVVPLWLLSRGEEEGKIWVAGEDLEEGG